MRFALRRAAGAIPILLGVATIVFFLFNLAPGDSTAMYFGPGMSAEVLEQVRRDLGLDAPIYVRYFRWLTASLQGDFGYSVVAGMPVRERLAAAIPNTLVLASGALLLAFLAGILLGVIQAVRRNSLVDSLLSFLALFFYSMPSFWLAIMLILLFSVLASSHGWIPFSLPSSGIVGTNHDTLGPLAQLLDRLRHMVLPTLSLFLVLAAGIARYVRASMLEVLDQDYVRTARAKGLGETTVILRHALRNALIPVVTLVGLYLPFLLSGAVFVEYVFAWPGMGKLMVDSIFMRDYPVVMAGTVVFGAMVIGGNLLADILYGVVDPRIRQEGRHG